MTMLTALLFSDIGNILDRCLWAELSSSPWSSCSGVYVWSGGRGWPAANALAAYGIGSKRMILHNFVSTDSGLLCCILFHFTHSHTARGRGETRSVEWCMYVISPAGRDLSPAFQAEGNFTPVALPVVPSPLSFCHPCFYKNLPQPFSYASFSGWRV